VVNVADLSIATLVGGDDSIIARSVRRLRRSLDDPDGIISAFQSYTS